MRTVKDLLSEDASRDPSISKFVNVDWEAFTQSQAQLESKVQKYKETQKNMHEEQQALEKQCKSHKTELSKVTKSFANILNKCGDKEAVEQAVAHQIEVSKQTADAAQKSIPQRSSFFFRLLLGDINNIILYPQNKRLQYKQEYETFKFQWTLMCMPFAFVLLFFVQSRAIDTIFQISLLYFYLTLTLRECILIANGSNIKTWWIAHHYLSILLTVCFLTWPKTTVYMAFRKQFFIYALYTCTIQLLQYQYQMGRLYTLKSLGRADVMDVANSETTQGIISWAFARILPFLFIGQGFQIYNAVTLFKMFINRNYPWSEWQIIALGSLFFVVGMGNLSSTMMVFKSKAKKKTRHDKKTE